MKIKPSSWFLIAILFVMVAVVVNSLTFKHFESAFLPLVLAGSIILLGAIELWRELSKGNETEQGDEKAPLMRKGTGFYPLMGWIVGFAVAIYVLGYLIAIALFLISFLLSEKFGWAKTIIIALATTATIYVLFEVLLRSGLWKGLIFL